MVHPKRLLCWGNKNKKPNQTKQQQQQKRNPQNCNKESVIFTKFLPSVHFNQFEETIFLYCFLYNRNFNFVTINLSTRE